MVWNVVGYVLEEIISSVGMLGHHWQIYGVVRLHVMVESPTCETTLLAQCV